MLEERRICKVFRQRDLDSPFAERKPREALKRKRLSKIVTFLVKKRPFYGAQLA